MDKYDHTFDIDLKNITVLGAPADREIVNINGIDRIIFSHDDISGDFPIDIENIVLLLNRHTDEGSEVRMTVSISQHKPASYKESLIKIAYSDEAPQHKYLLPHNYDYLYQISLRRTFIKGKAGIEFNLNISNPNLSELEKFVSSFFFHFSFAVLDSGLPMRVITSGNTGTPIREIYEPGKVRRPVGDFRKIVNSIALDIQARCNKGISHAFLSTHRAYIFNIDRRTLYSGPSHSNIRNDPFYGISDTTDIIPMRNLFANGERIIDVGIEAFVGKTDEEALVIIDEIIRALRMKTLVTDTVYLLYVKPSTYANLLQNNIGIENIKTKIVILDQNEL